MAIWRTILAALLFAPGAQCLQLHKPPSDFGRFVRRGIGSVAAGLGGFLGGGFTGSDGGGGVGGGGRGGSSGDFGHGGNDWQWGVPSADASIFKKYVKRNLQERIAAIPVFIVCNQYNSPYLSFRGRDAKIFMFLDAADAEACLLELVQTSSDGLPDAHLTVMSMDRAFKLARGGARPTGNVDPMTGSDVLMTYQFAPSAAALEDAYREASKVLPRNAKGVAPSKLGKVAGSVASAAGGGGGGFGTPGFEAKGLTIVRGKERIRPLFLSFDDLMDAWQEERTLNPAMPAKPEVEVVDVMTLCLALELKEKGSESSELANLEDYGIVPANENVEYVEELRRRGTGKARLHVGM